MYIITSPSHPTYPMVRAAATIKEAGLREGISELWEAEEGGPVDLLKDPDMLAMVAPFFLINNH